MRPAGFDPQAAFLAAQPARCRKFENFFCRQANKPETPEELAILAKEYALLRRPDNGSYTFHFILSDKKEIGRALQPTLRAIEGPDISALDGTSYTTKTEENPTIFLRFADCQKTHR